MTDENTVEATESTSGAPTPNDMPKTAPKHPEPARELSLEESLAGLDDAVRSRILEEMSKKNGEARNLRERLKQAEPKLSEYDKLIEASKSELERAQEAAKHEADRASSLLSRAVKSEVKALAQGFADPEDAAAFLDLSKYATGDGDVDSASIKADLADLLARKPHLGKSPETRLPAPNPAQGSSGSGPSGASQLTEQEVTRMYKARDYDGIEKARTEGRLNTVLGIN